MNPLKQNGYVTESDRKVPVSVRDWNAMKLAVWRSKVAWDIVVRESTELIARAAHMTGCPAVESETATCLSDCPDRELRLSALVILNAARRFAPVDARKVADGPYVAPTREYFSEVLAELAACQAQIAAIVAGGQPVPLPPPNEEKNA
jgi:hypothetical protein